MATLTRIDHEMKKGSIGEYGGSLAAAVAANPTGQVTIVIDTVPNALTANVTAPDNIIWEWKAGCVAALGAYNFVTKNIIAGNYQLFDASGAGVVSGLKHVKPEWWGAVGDGVADDSLSIKSVLEMGSIVNLQPNATYLLSTDQTILAASSTLVYGNNATIKFDNTTVRPIIIRSDNTRWYDITLEGKTGVLHNGFAVQNSSDHKFVRCTADNMGFYGFAVAENTDTNVAGACNNLWYIDCVAKDCGYFGFEVFPKLKSETHRYINCVAIDCGSAVTTGAGFKTGQAVVDAQTINCTAIGCENGLLLANWETHIVKGFQSINSRRLGTGITVADWTGTYLTYTAGHDQLHLDTGISETSDYTGGDSSAPGFQITSAPPTNVPKDIKINLYTNSTTGNPIDVKPVNDIDYRVFFESLICHDVGAFQPGFRDSLGGTLNDLHIAYMEFDFTDANNVNTRVLLDANNAEIGEVVIKRAGQYAIEVSGDNNSIGTARFIECNYTNVASRAPVLFAETTAVRLDIHNIEIQNGQNGHVDSALTASNSTPTIGYGTITSDSAVTLRVTTSVTVEDLEANVTIN